MNNPGIDQIKYAVKQLLIKTGTVLSFPLPLEKIALKLGFTCHDFWPDPDVADIVGTVDHQKRLLYMNQNCTPVQRYVALARMIGHIILYSANQDYITLKQSNFLQNKERELDQFAHILLMPEALYKQKWQELGQDAEAMAYFFKVNKQLIIARAQNLDIATTIA